MPHRAPAGTAPHQLTARSWDRRAREWLAGDGERGSVVAIYTRALHVESPDETLLSVVEPAAGNAPMTLVVELPAGHSFQTLGLSPGAPASVVASTLLLGMLSISLEGARLWAPVGRPPAPVAPERLTSGAALLRLASLEAGQRGGFYPLIDHMGELLPGSGSPPDTDGLTRFAWPRLVALLRAWREGDPDRIAMACTDVVGLGPGATPSGDDLLAGLMVAFRWGLVALGRDEEEANRRCDACLASARETTRLSRARLRQAAEGEIDQAVDELFPPLFAGDGATLGSQVEKVAHIGHSSGTDTLAGILLGIQLALELS